MSVYTRPYSEREGSEFQAYDGFVIEYRDASHRYHLHINGKRIPAVSVTAALKVLDKAALLNWAEGAGIEGARQALCDGIVHPKQSPERWVAAVRGAELGMKAKRDAGADRGTAIHRVLELWGSQQHVPSLAEFPQELHGYVAGLCAWLLKARPRATSVERFVAHPGLGYAGRMDMRADIDGADTIVDLKTSRKAIVFDEAHLQARAYEMADYECGQPRADRIIIVGVGEDGNFQQVDCEAQQHDWLTVLETYRVMAKLRSARSAREKVRAAA